MTYDLKQMNETQEQTIERQWHIIAKQQRRIDNLVRIVEKMNRAPALSVKDQRLEAAEQIFAKV